MPSLPFTFDDLRKLDIPAQAAETSAPEMPQVDPQAFLGNAVDRVKEQFGTTEGLIDTGLAINPVLVKLVDQYGCQVLCQTNPGIQEGFTKGTTMTGDVHERRSHSMPF